MNGWFLYFLMVNLGKYTIHWVFGIDIESSSLPSEHVLGDAKTAIFPQNTPLHDLVFLSWLNDGWGDGQKTFG